MQRRIGDKTGRYCCRDFEGKTMGKKYTETQACVHIYIRTEGR